MNFIDEAKIYLKAGDGGDGCVSFRREKYIEMGGPNGGDGGSGGSVIFRSNVGLNTLVNFRYKQHFKAKNGENGKGSNKTGKSGSDLILEVPVGTQIFLEDGSELLYDFVKDNDVFEIVTGGKGGLGNVHFKSSTNQAPRLRTEGIEGKELWVSLKLKLLSDAGLVGLPNAGKSTFLSIATSAKPKIADYPFTTLSPSLGVVYVGDEEYVLADLPGLIEGAHEGHGLGDKFLKHIERCGILIHLIDATSQQIDQDYKIIRHELNSYSTSLKDKFEIVCLSKCDALLPEEIEQQISKLKNLVPGVIIPISSFTKAGVNEVLKLALEVIKKSRESSSKTL